MSRAPVAAAALLGAVAGHAGPALTSIPGLRRCLTPALAGIGDPSHVALTFDDGPHREGTPMLLEILERHQVRATFFLLGRMLREHPDVGRAIHDAGHEVALHGDEHRCHLFLAPHAVHRDLVRGYESIAQIIGSPPRWYRPPYGAISSGTLYAARRLGLTPVLWSAWGRDWTRHATAQSVCRTVSRGVLAGGTVLLHDSDATSAPGSWRTTASAVPQLLDGLRRCGLRVGPLAEHRIAA